MTAEDLLKRTLRYLQKTDAVNTLAEDIEKYLAEPKDEPVAWKSENDSIDLQSRCRGDKE